MRNVERVVPSKNAFPISGNRSFMNFPCCRVPIRIKVSRLVPLAGIESIRGSSDRPQGVIPRFRLKREKPEGT